MSAAVVSLLSAVSGRPKRQTSRHYNQSSSLIAGPSKFVRPSKDFNDNPFDTISSTQSPLNTPTASEASLSSIYERIRSGNSSQRTECPKDRSPHHATDEDNSPTFSMYVMAGGISGPSSHASAHDPPELSGPSVVMGASDVTYGQPRTRGLSSRGYGNTFGGDRTQSSNPWNPVRPVQSSVIRKTVRAPRRRGYSNHRSVRSSQWHPGGTVPMSIIRAREERRNKYSAFADWIADYLYVYICHAYDIPISEFHSSNYATYVRDQVGDNIYDIITTIQMEPATMFLSLWYISKLPIEVFDSPHLENEVPPDTDQIMLRAFVVGAILAAKWLDDFVIKLQQWAKMSHLSLALVNSMERSAYAVLNYNIYISCCEWHFWLININHHHSNAPSFEPVETQPMLRIQIGGAIKRLLDYSCARECTAAPPSCPDKTHRRFQSVSTSRDPPSAMSPGHEAANYYPSKRTSPSPGGPRLPACPPLAPPRFPEAAPLGKTPNGVGIIGEGVPGGRHRLEHSATESQYPVVPSGSEPADNDASPEVRQVMPGAYLSAELPSRVCPPPAPWHPEADPIIPRASRMMNHASGYDSAAESISGNPVGWRPSSLVRSWDYFLQVFGQ